jgi:hypothetical protein
MNRLLIVVSLVSFTVPLCAQGQQQNVAKLSSMLETTTATLALELAARELECRWKKAAIRFSTQLKERFQIRHRIGILNA